MINCIERYLMKDFWTIFVCIIIGLIITAIEVCYFSEEKKAERRKNKNKNYCKNKSNYTFYEDFDFPEISDELKFSHIFYPDGAYNQCLQNVIAIEEDDFTLYLGDFFYQKDVAKNNLEKNMETFAKIVGKSRRYHDADPYKYDEDTWPEIVPVPESIGENIHNYYYFQKFAVIKPKYKMYFPNFMIRLKRLGLEKFENIIKLPGHPIFNWTYMLSSKPNDYDVELFFNYSRTRSIDRLIDSSYIYETVNGLFIIKSESTALDTLERLHQNALAMFGGWLCDKESNLRKKYAPSIFYFASASKLKLAKIMMILVFAWFCWCVYNYGIHKDADKKIQNKFFSQTLDYKFKHLVSDKKYYVPELMKNYTWKNIKRTRLVDAMVFSYEQINDPKCEKYFQPRFEVVKPQNLESYPTDLVPRIKEKLGYIQNYSARTYDQAMQSPYKCDTDLIVDTAALWLFVSRHFAMNGDLETAFLLPYAGIISAYESENNTADAMNINNRIQHLDAMNISAYHLLYLAVKYEPDCKLLKSIAKDMLTIARKQFPCSVYIKYFKQQFIEVFNKEQQKAPENSYINLLYKYNIIESYTKAFLDDYLQFADAPYATIRKEYLNWYPNISATEGPDEKIDTIGIFTNYLFRNKYGSGSNLTLFRKITEEYLTKLEGIAIALLYRAYAIENGCPPKSITDLEYWSEEMIPVDRFTNMPYKINNNSNKILFSAGPDFKPNTQNDIRFW